MEQIKKKMGKFITWDELANLYDACHTGRRARTMEMKIVFEWAESQTDDFMLDEDGYLHEIEKE